MPNLSVVGNKLDIMIQYYWESVDYMWREQYRNGEPVDLGLMVEYAHGLKAMLSGLDSCSPVGGSSNV